MELRHLRYFVAVAEAENVSRAAIKLHVSQPGISRQIRDLEDELGFSLFERSAKSIKLTKAGKSFLTEARAVLQRVDEAVKTARAIATGEQGELHVGYAPSPTSRILPPALRAFQAELPNVRVKLHDFSTEEMVTGLREGKLHIAFVVRLNEGRLRGLQFEKLIEDSTFLAVAPNHPLAKRRSISLAEVVREPIVVYSRAEYPEAYEELVKMFAHTKSKPQIAAEHDGVASLIAGVESGEGVALVPESIGCISGPRLKLVRVSPAPPPLVIGAAWLKDGLSPTAERFLKCAREVAAKL